MINQIIIPEIDTDFKEWSTEIGHQLTDIKDRVLKMTTEVTEANYRNADSLAFQSVALLDLAQVGNDIKKIRYLLHREGVLQEIIIAQIVRVNRNIEITGQLLEDNKFLFHFNEGCKQVIKPLNATKQAFQKDKSFDKMTKRLSVVKNRVIELLETTVLTEGESIRSLYVTMSTIAKLEELNDNVDRMYEDIAEGRLSFENVYRAHLIDERIHELNKFFDKHSSILDHLKGETHD